MTMTHVCIDPGPVTPFQSCLACVEGATPAAGFLRSAPRSFIPIDAASMSELASNRVARRSSREKI